MSNDNNLVFVWKDDNDDIQSSHDIANINNDPRTPLMLATIKTMKETSKCKLDDNIWLIRNTTILSMAKEEAKNKNLTTLYYQDQEKFIIITSNNVDIQWKKN